MFSLLESMRPGQSRREGAMNKWVVAEVREKDPKSHILFVFYGILLIIWGLSRLRRVPPSVHQPSNKPKKSK